MPIEGATVQALQCTVLAIVRILFQRKCSGTILHFLPNFSPDWVPNACTCEDMWIGRFLHRFSTLITIPSSVWPQAHYSAPKRPIFDIFEVLSGRKSAQFAALLHFCLRFGIVFRRHGIARAIARLFMRIDGGLGKARAP